MNQPSVIYPVPAIVPRFLAGCVSLRKIETDGSGAYVITCHLLLRHMECFSVYQSRVKRRRGHNTGMRTKSATALRINNIFGDDSSSTAHQPKSGNSTRPICPLSENRVKQNDAWAAEVLEAVGKNTASSSKPDTSQAESDDVRYNTRHVLRRLEDGMRRVSTAVDSLIQQRTITVSEDRHHADTGSAPHSQFDSMHYPHRSVVASASLSGREPIPDQHRGILVLDDHEIPFDKRVPLCDPPGIHFSQQISQLFQHWHNSDLVRLNGHGIPVKHWDKLFKVRGAGVGHSGQWATIRVEWGNWKYIVEEMELLGSENAFWIKYTDGNGEPCQYKSILNMLKTARITKDVRDAENAKTYFGNDLARADANGAFMYRKTGALHVLTKTDKIANAWRGLLARDPGVAQAWQAMEAAAHGI
ncbi:hypothetical protein BDW22DRAFT_11297 [Trametopsis cervina]|nr:hypothetical protein BDW22DRAFT_11297 [Trametopsis cervina]